MLSAGSPMVVVSFVTCIAALSKPADTSASTYARPETEFGEFHTGSATARKKARLSAAVPSSRSVGVAGDAATDCVGDAEAAGDVCAVGADAVAADAVGADAVGAGPAVQPAIHTAANNSAAAAAARRRSAGGTGRNTHRVYFDHSAGIRDVRTGLPRRHTRVRE